MDNRTKQTSVTANTKAYTNSVDANYHLQNNCRWMLPVKYQEIEVGEVTRMGKKPCKNCTG